MEFNTQKLYVFTIFLGLLLPSLCAGESIGIWHYGDISGQLESFKVGTHNGPTAPESCKQSDTSCIGGLANIAKQINTDITGTAKTFRLSTGNLVGGENGWLSLIGWDKYGELVEKYYKPDAMAMGIKEFGAGLITTNSYVNKTSKDILLSGIVSCNLYGSSDPEEKKVCDKTIQVFEISSQVAVFGFINPNAAKLGITGRLTFKDIAQGVRDVINSHTKYTSFIAIGDGSLDIAKSILDTSDKVKLVLYGSGFSNTKNMTEYPEKYKHGYIATAGRYGSTIGQLVLNVNNNGGIDSITGNLITPKGVIDPIPEVTDASAIVDNARTTHIGRSIFQLEGGEKCWSKECNLGNLVADSMVHCAYQKANRTTEPVIGLWHAGALFNDLVKGRDISVLDVHKWLPYHNRAILRKISGKNLYRLLEKGAEGITSTSNTRVPNWGQFLQVSNGIEIFYFTSGSASITNTIEQIEILHNENSLPIMKPIQMDVIYTVVVPTMINEGRSVFDMAAESNFWADNGQDIGFDDDCVANYIKAMGTVTIGFEERIWVDSSMCTTTEITKTEKKGGNTAVTVILTIIFTLMVLGIAFVGYVYVFPRVMGRTPDGFRNFE